MREFNLLNGYPNPNNPRFVSKNLRTIQKRIQATGRNKSFFDGDRTEGYGGFSYDGRWKLIAERIITEYKISKHSNLLHINSEKGFLLNDLKIKSPSINIFGTETSNYAKNNSMESIRENIFDANPKSLPFPNQYFDFVIAIGVVYGFNLKDSIKVLREISRVSKGKSFITLASYDTEEDYFLFKDWTLLGATILRKEEWVEVLNHADYQGDYNFTNARTLNLKRT